ncbi:hypothetical protein [Pelistega ratti]|uniref:hypothetical protein n=1 Tax=Pelistega ratti TaxID=2652177 RepID=UPI0013D4FB4F|nr:hypothetical protein [Pelistega ratti]
MTDNVLKDWEQTSRMEIERILSDVNFPCVFGRKANQNNTIKWLNGNNISYMKQVG